MMNTAPRPRGRPLVRQGACVGSGRHPTTTCTHTGAMRHATSGTGVEGLWVSMWAWVASRGPPNRRSQIAGPGGYVSVPLAPGTKHRTASRPCGYLCLSARRRDMIALGNSEPRGRPRPLPGPGVGGLALVVTAAGPHPPPPHMSPPTSLLQPTAPQSPPTKAPGIVQSHLKSPCLCSDLCRRAPLTRGAAGVGGRGGEGADAQHRRRAQS